MSSWACRCAHPGSSLSFPAAGQTWPTLSPLYIGGSVTPTPSAITGTVGATGKVDLRLDHELKIGTINGLCTLTGTAELSSRHIGNELAHRTRTCTTPFMQSARASATTPERARSISRAITTEQGIRMVQSAPRFPGCKVFWSTDLSRVEAVFGV